MYNLSAAQSTIKIWCSFEKTRSNDTGEEWLSLSITAIDEDRFLFRYTNIDVLINIIQPWWHSGFLIQICASYYNLNFPSVCLFHIWSTIYQPIGTKSQFSVSVAHLPVYAGERQAWMPHCRCTCVGPTLSVLSCFSPRSVVRLSITWGICG